MATSELFSPELAKIGHDDSAAGFALHSRDVEALDDVDALCGECVTDPGGDLWLLAARELRAHQHGHARAEVREQLGLLHRDVAAAQDDHRRRQVIELHRRRRRQVAAVAQSRDGGDVRLGTRSDEILRGVDSPPVDLEAGPVDEARVALDELDGVLAREIDVLVLAHPLDDLPLAGDQIRELDRARLGSDAREAVQLRAVACLGRRKQRLGGNATDVHARPADRPALDHRHAQLPAARGDRRRKRAAPRPDDRQVVVEVPTPGPRAVDGRIAGGDAVVGHQQGLESVRRQAATCSALSSSSARPSASSSATRGSAIR